MSLVRWVAVCTDLLEAAKELTGLRLLREPLTSRGFQCGTVQRYGAYSIFVPPDFPCYHDLVGKSYVNQGHANSLNTLMNYLERALALVQNGGAYRTEAEYNSRAPAPVRGGPARTLPKRRHYGKSIEGAQQKQNGKWTCPHLFPGRDFDDLDEYRAAKKQRVAQKYR